MVDTAGATTAAAPGGRPASDRRSIGARRRSWRPIVAVGCVVALVVVVLGTRDRSSTDTGPTTPPVVQEPGLVGATPPPLEDPRANPAFDEAYDTVCQQTISGLDAMYAAVGSPDLMATINAQHLALTERIASVYERQDLWGATEPLVLEYAETIADDLASILDGTEVGFDYLDGDVALFRSLCEDWFAPF